MLSGDGIAWRDSVGVDRGWYSASERAVAIGVVQLLSPLGI
jgi:hypothetical protein